MAVEVLAKARAMNLPEEAAQVAAIETQTRCQVRHGKVAQRHRFDQLQAALVVVRVLKLELAEPAKVFDGEVGQVEQN